MARKHEAVEWLKKGYSPSKIAEQMGVTVSTIMGYLYNQVGEGNIRRSDILFSIDRNTRDTIETIITKLNTTYWYSIHEEAKKNGIDLNRDDLEVYLKLRDVRVALGDMYEYIREIEISLHDLIKKTLISKYGSEDWWRKGVSSKIRSRCAAAREMDPEPAKEPYCYTNFIDLGKIMEKQWEAFKKILPPKLSSNRKDLLSRLTRINRIRNSVMHPAKGSELDENDFSFVRELRSDFTIHIRE
jgi:hypothetical protein